MDINEKKAIENYSKKNYPAALRAFLKIDGEQPDRENILIYIANCYDGVGKKLDAIKYYRKVLKINKNSDSAAANLAIIFYELKKFWRAKWYAAKAIKINPFNVYALAVYGNIYHKQKKYHQALKFYQKALDFQRDFYTANFNTAGIYYELKNYKTSYYYAKKTLQYHPDSDEAKELLVNNCMMLEKFEEAKETLLELYLKNPLDYWLCNLLSQVYQQTKEYDKALEIGYQAISLSRGDDAQQINFGYLLYEIAVENQESKVKEYAQIWLEKYPNNPITKHMATAIINAGAANQIDSAFVREIFDAFAEDFDEVLQNLNYSVPSLMSGYLDSLSQNVKLKKMRILDAGCGTGLCGNYLKKYAGFLGLDGVDISDKMLAAARSKKIYNRLYNQELSKFLFNHNQVYDLINAADVFTYFGDLDRLFSLLYKSLRREGRVLFSVSENALNDKEYFLHLSGRFVHNKDYVEKMLVKHNFFVEKINRVHLRNEGEVEVYGWIVMARKM